MVQKKPKYQKFIKIGRLQIDTKNIQIGLYLPKEIVKFIDKEAKYNCRSRGQQIKSILLNWYRKEKLENEN